MFLSFLELRSRRSLNCGFETTWSWINNSIILIFWGVNCAWCNISPSYHIHGEVCCDMMQSFCKDFRVHFLKALFHLSAYKNMLAKHVGISLVYSLHEIHFLQQEGWGCYTSSLELAASRLPVLVSPSSLFLSLADDGMLKQLWWFAAAALMGMHGTGPGASLRYELNHWAELNGVRNGRLTLYMG